MRSPQWLTAMADRGPAAAIVDNGITFSYGELASRIGELMNQLNQAGVERGDAIALHADYSFDSICGFFALAAIGAITAPVTTLTPAVEETLRTACAARYLYRPQTDHSLERWPMQETPPLYAKLHAAGHAGLVLLSSGTTGRPKAILHNLDSLLAAPKTGGAKRGLKILLLLLFDHIGGINTLINTLLSGGTAVTVRERSPEAVCSLIAAHSIQVLPGNPTFLNLILLDRCHERFDLSCLRLITYGTEPMPEQLLLRIRAAFPKVRLLQTFGTSETGIARTQSASSESTLFKISDGAHEYRIVDGELQLRSKTQFLGYLNSADMAVTSDGWFRTGDFAECGEDGFLRILGRTKETINVGGEKVLPLELESLLLEHELVADCVAYGVPNAITGQSVCVDVVPARTIDQTEMRRELLAFLTGKVERFKIPGRIRLVDTIETSERFKKRRIRA